MKKLISALLAILMLFTLLAVSGCTNNDDDDRPTLTMATNADFPPFEFINDDGDYDGFDVHLAEAIADVLGKRLVIRNMDFDLVIPAIETAQADIGIAAITITEERAQQVYFTIPYFETDLVVIVMADSDIETIADLDGKTVAVQRGTTSDLWLDLNGSSIGIDVENNVTRLASPPFTVLELTLGRAQAIIIDAKVANEFVADNSDLRILEEPLGQESYGMVLRQGNSELLEAVNNAIQELKDNGEFDRIFNEFFGGEED